MFKLGNGIFEIITKDANNRTTVLFSTSISKVNPYIDNLFFKVSKRNNIYSFTIDTYEIKDISLPVEINNYLLTSFMTSLAKSSLRFSIPSPT